MPAEISGRPSLCVVGTGALGSALLDRLRQHSFHSVLLVDPDKVEPRNLPLSPLLARAVTHAESSAAQTAAPTRNKAGLLAAAARDLDGLPWQFRSCEIADVGWGDIYEADLLCCCTDSILSRVETAWIARALHRPMLDGGVFGQGIALGRVSVFSPHPAGACTLCGLSEDRRAAVLSYAASASLGCHVPESTPAMTGALATLNAVADALLAQISRWSPRHGAMSRSSRLTQAADGHWQTETFDLTRSATCPWHDGMPGALDALPWEAPVDAAFEEGTRELVLSWPVCTEAVCEACGTRSRPMQRVARVRRSCCAACGQAKLQPLRAIHRIRAGDPSSLFSPRQLGMPERHLYWMREAHHLPGPRDLSQPEAVE